MKCSQTVRAVTLFFFSYALLCIPAHAQKPPAALPVDVLIPIAPTPVRAAGAQNLVYELHLTNFRSKPIELLRVEVLDSTRVVASYKDDELKGMLARPGLGDVADKRVIAGGTRAVIYMRLILAGRAAVPDVLRHRLIFKADTPGAGQTETPVESGEVKVFKARPPVISPPLRGGGWLALNGLSNSSVHRRTIVVVNGKARIAQRFATDWTRIGADGQAFRGNPADNRNWSAYGAEVFAAAAGVVVDVHDGIPDNDPTADKKAVPITLETVAGNYLIVDMGHGYFSFYAHLKPGSIIVRKGQRVRAGQRLALLGNSGNSDAPHLHFHVTNGNSPLGAEGVPYVIDTFEVEGFLPSKALLVNGQGWKPEAGRKRDVRRLEIPLENSVVRFR